MFAVYMFAHTSCSRVSQAPQSKSLYLHWPAMAAALALATPGVGNHSTPRVVRVALLQRMSDARLKSAELCDGAAGKWAGGTCWLGEGWQAVAAAGLAAANDFNARVGTYVPQFASEAMQACDVQLSVSVLDSGSTAMHALEQLTTQVLDENTAPDVRRRPSPATCQHAPLVRCLPARALTQLSTAKHRWSSGLCGAQSARRLPCCSGCATRRRSHTARPLRP